jgi:uncharacterized protein
LVYLSLCVLIYEMFMRRQITMTRRSFLKKSALALGGIATMSDLTAAAGPPAAQQGTSRVFFTQNISADGFLKAYSKIGRNIIGRVAIKVHTGEPHGPNILPRDMVKALQQHIPASILVETNTLYKGKRFGWATISTS